MPLPLPSFCPPLPPPPPHLYRAVGNEPTRQQALGKVGPFSTTHSLWCQANECDFYSQVGGVSAHVRSKQNDVTSEELYRQAHTLLRLQGERRWWWEDLRGSIQSFTCRKTATMRSQGWEDAGGSLGHSGTWYKEGRSVPTSWKQDNRESKVGELELGGWENAYNGQVTSSLCLAESKLFPDSIEWLRIGLSPSVIVWEEKWSQSP